MNNTCPTYIKNLLKTKKCGQGLQSNKHAILEIANTNLISCGSRTFCNAAPVLWNELMDELENKKS